MRPPLAGGTWESCPIQDLIAAYRNSPATPENPTAQARVYVLPDGKGMAEGGDPAFLAVFKARKAQIVEYLQQPCSECETRLGTRPVDVATNPRQVCEDCFDELIQAHLDTTSARIEAVGAPAS